MVEVATNWFGFEAAAQTGNRASGNGIVVHVQDGVEFVSHAEKLGKKGLWLETSGVLWEECVCEDSSV